VLRRLIVRLEEVVRSAVGGGDHRNERLLGPTSFE
jgi:hypothetical protein